MRSTRFWARFGGAMALLLSGWFFWSVVLVALWHRNTYGISRVPISPWAFVNGAIFLALAVGAFREREGARPWLLGSGLVTVLLSAAAMRMNRWDAVAVALGALLALSGWMWERAVRAQNRA